MIWGVQFWIGGACVFDVAYKTEAAAARAYCVVSKAMLNRETFEAVPSVALVDDWGRGYTVNLFGFTSILLTSNEQARIIEIEAKKSRQEVKERYPDSTKTEAGFMPS